MATPSERSSSAKSKSGSARKKNSALEEAKARGRHLRSMQKDGGLPSLFEGLKLEDIECQPKGVGLVHDEQMLEHCCVWDPKHPEKPDRLRCVYERCQHYGLINRCVQIKSGEATEDDILLYHSPQYLETIKSSRLMSQEQLMELSSKYDGIYFHNSTYRAACLALGSTLRLVEQVIKGQVRHGMALVRPPGHHAMRDEANGYCFFNNVAIAAKHAIKNLGMRRVLIVDWDVHHGQGIQQAFYNDPRVLYFSVHRYDHGDFWPNLRQSDSDQVGEGKGRGYNINVPLNKTGMTNGDYLAIWTQILLPVAYEYRPDLILVSAGYDAALGCPEGEMQVSPVMYAHLTSLLQPLAKGRLVAVLEGGYCRRSLAESGAMTLRTLLGDPCPYMEPLDPPCESVVASILGTICALRPFWRSLQYQGSLPPGVKPELFSRHASTKQIEFATAENRPEKYGIVGDYLIHTEDKELELDALVERVIDDTTLPSYPNRTCCIYDERMKKHRSHTMQAHPERPDRIVRIHEKHREVGLLSRIKMVEARFAKERELVLIHKTDYIRQVQHFAQISEEEYSQIECRFNSIYLSPEVYESALLATGCVLSVVDEVCSDQSRNGVAIVRPPGHHAEVDTACGFCYFNHVAIAARYSQRRHKLKRVMILDWDVHHGNGIQNALQDDPSILYISIHRHDHGWFFPSGDAGDFIQVGRGAGEGFNINIPWNCRDLGDTEYIAAFQQIVLPIAYEFAPELVLISAGFDAARGDPLGGMKVSPEGYAHMTHMLQGLAGGKVIMVLEGGYNLISISESMTLCTSILLGDQCPQVKVGRPAPNIQTSELETRCCEKYNRCTRYAQQILEVSQVPSILDFLEKPAVTGPVPASAGIVEDPKKHSTYFHHCYGMTTVNIPVDLTEVPEEEAKEECSMVKSETDSLAELTDSFASSMSLDAKSECSDISLSQHSDIDGHFTDIKTEDQLECAEGVKPPGEEAVPMEPVSFSETLPGLGTLPPVGAEMHLELEAGHEDAAACDSAPPKLLKMEQPDYSGAGEHFEEPPELMCEVDLSSADLASLEGACGGCDPAQGQAISDIVMDNQTMFTVVPLSWCPHLEDVQPLPPGGIDTQQPCLECQNVGENWLCLQCYEVHCSRYVKEHMLFHGIETGHRMVLSFADLSVWCYACDSYVHNDILFPAKREAHLNKFGEDVPGL